MGIWSRLKNGWSRLTKRRNDEIERRRTAATLEAASLGATPEQARKIGDRAASGHTNTAIIGAINT
ncbi:hypothetical protein [Catenuloplanes japonicus]|uniref:hypothetical protein n=1 Tax=Catenuloplanes japonicus TaxID=33876 RepID=UPI000527B490|nr:hypothetical protein [Catenuloplanes japonicus]